MEFPSVAGIEVAHNDDGVVRLAFEDSSGVKTTHYLDPSTSQWLLSQLVEKLGSGRVSPISRRDLRRGTPIRVNLVQPSPHPDGARVVLFAEVDGRRVTVPFVLSFDQIAEIVIASRTPANDG
jgi:hypothetical protein